MYGKSRTKHHFACLSLHNGSECLLPLIVRDTLLCNNLVEFVLKKLMPRLSSLDRGRALGQLQAGVRRSVVAARFGVSQAAVCNLQIRYQDTGDVRNRPRSGRPRVTSAATDRRIEALAA